MQSRRSMTRTAWTIITALAVSVCVPQVFAQTYPTKPIRFVVANSAGGGLDITARTVAPCLIAALGQQVIIDNRGGPVGSFAT